MTPPYDSSFPSPSSLRLSPREASPREGKNRSLRLLRTRRIPCLRCRYRTHTPCRHRTISPVRRGDAIRSLRRQDILLQDWVLRDPSPRHLLLCQSGIRTLVQQQFHKPLSGSIARPVDGEAQSRAADSIRSVDVGLVADQGIGKSVTSGLLGLLGGVHQRGCVLR